VPARLFSRTTKIKKVFFRTSKTFLLFLFLFVTLASNIAPVFAQTGSPWPQCTDSAGQSYPCPDDTYNNYRYLFNTVGHNGLAVGTNTSRFWYKSPIVDQATKTVPGLWFGFTFSFDSTANDQRNAEYTWDHIAAPANVILGGQFVVRLCDQGTTTNCLFTPVAYANLQIPGRSGNGLFDSATNTIMNLASLGQWGKVQNKTIEAAYKSTSTIFRKDPTDKYFNAEAVDIAGGLWGSINANGSIELQEVNWLTKKTQTASLWYCAAPLNGNGGTRQGPIDTDPRNAADRQNNPDIQKFGNLCEGNSYFKIGEDTVTPPASFDIAAATQAETTKEEPIKSVEAGSALPECSLILGSGSFLGCIARFVYYVIFSPLQYFGALMGKLFDFFLGFSIGDEAYRMPFIVQGWKMIRDISNIFFIIILIWTGLAAVFDIGKASMKQVVPNLIMNALLINFSLFGTRVVIDISNIFSRVFYNTMNVSKIDPNTGQPVGFGEENIGGYKPLSEKIVSSFNPQRMFSQQVLSKANSATIANKGVAATVDNDRDGKLADPSSSQYAGYFILVSIISAMLMFSIAMMFWKTGFLFLGRIIGLYVVMMFSPFAVLTRKNMPLIGNIKQLKWDDWIGELTNYALLAPIFILFLYLVYAFTQSNFFSTFLQETATTDSFFVIVLKISIPMLIVYTLISYGVKIAKSYAGKIGEMVQGYAVKAAGFVGGAALGAGAVVGSRVVGGVGRSLDRSRVGVGIRNMASRGGIEGWLGKRLQTGLNKTQSGSFDVRQSSLGQKLFKEMGVDTNQKGLDTLKTIGIGPGLSTEQRKGGLDASIKRQQEMREKQVKLFDEKMDIDAFNERQKKRHHINTVLLNQSVEKEMVQRWSEGDLAAWKQNPDKTEYNERRRTVIQNTNNQAIQLRAAIEQKGPEKLRSAEELENARRKTFTDSLKAGSLLTQITDSLATQGIFGEALAGAIGVTIGTTAGALIGQQIETAGDRKAAKKIGERNKIEKELKDVKDTIEKGFRDLIAVEMYQTSDSFNNIPDPERKKRILAGKESMYDILNSTEKAAVDTRRSDLSSAQKDQYLDLVAARLTTKDLKELNRNIRAAETAWQNSAGTAAQVDNYKQWKDLLAEKNEAEKMNRQFRDYKEYIKKEKEKLKPKEEGK
jgi:hypothetical protein